MSFTKAMIRVRRSEGGYVNDPDDAGGETYCGISRKFFPKWEGWKIIDVIKKHKGGRLKINYKIPREDLKRLIGIFYYKYFWKPLKCTKITNPILAEHLFDCGINLGKKSAVKFFQECCNDLPLHMPLLIVDGLIGPKTISSINKINNHFANKIVEYRIELYFRKCYTKPVKFKYLKGWVLRSLKYIQKPT